MKNILLLILINFTFSVYSQNDSIYTFVEEYAEFPGGFLECKKYIESHIKYQNLSNSSIQGVTFVSFIISKNGELSNFQIHKSFEGCQECDIQALEIAKNMPPWIPARNQGINVSSKFYLPIRFNDGDNDDGKKKK